MVYPKKLIIEKESHAKILKHLGFNIELGKMVDENLEADIEEALADEISIKGTDYKIDEPNDYGLMCLEIIDLIPKD
ncbi:MAG: hypothetical protein ACRCUS_08970 [Anaerovoracaceae bacterium]